ncbi:MAG: ribonuclease H-like domain-containing protein [Candidatus Aenigmatarchaeota archaeon]
MIFFDIETTSLKADEGILVASGFILQNGETKIFFSENPDDEKNVIKKTLEIFNQSKNEEIVIWYSDFDIPFLVSRAIKHGLDASLVYELKIIDICKLIRENLKFRSNKLDEVAKFFGIEKNLKITGKDVQRLYIKFLSGSKKAREEIIEHCKDDLKAMKEIFEKVKSYVQKWKNKNSKF